MMAFPWRDLLANWRVMRAMRPHPDEDAPYLHRVIGQSAPIVAWAALLLGISQAAQAAIQVLAYCGQWLRWLASFVFVLALVVLTSPALAQEAWCNANPANCLCSDQFQSTTYSTRFIDDAQSAGFIGDQVGSKACLFDSGHGTVSISWNGGAGSTFGSMAQVAADPAVLALLPNRNTSAVARYLRFALDNNNSPMRFGSFQINLTGVKRMALRWYSYHSPNYEWQGMGSCTNGKIAHSGACIIQSSATCPLLTHSISSGTNTYFYTFNTSLGWTSTVHPSFGGFAQGSGPYAGTNYQPLNYRGKWHRHEIVVSNPRASDAGGYNYRYFVKNVTDNLAEVEDTSLATGTCNNCYQIPDGGTIQNYPGDSGIHPSVDVTMLHTEFTRDIGSGPCAGWQGWMYVAMATWTTDAGQRIGVATEVEGGGGGGSPPNAPSNLIVHGIIILALAVGLAVAASRVSA